MCNEHRMYSSVIIRRSMLRNDCAVDSPACLLAHPLITTRLLLPLAVCVYGREQANGENLCGGGSAVQWNPFLARCFTCPIRCHFRQATAHTTHTAKVESLTELAFLVCRWYLPPSSSFCGSSALSPSQLHHHHPLPFFSAATLLPLPLFSLPPPLSSTHRDRSLGTSRSLVRIVVLHL